MTKDTTDVQTTPPPAKTSAKMQSRKNSSGDNGDKRLTIYAIREITGIDDENLIQAILVSGASRREIQQAYDHCRGVHHTKLISRKPMTERAKNLSDLIELGHDDMG